VQMTEVDVSTGEVRQRPLTAAEQKQLDTDRAAAAATDKAERDATTKRVADEQAWRDAMKNASSLAALKDVLLGTNLPTQADTRPSR
jgi:hypothetical protein